MSSGGVVVMRDQERPTTAFPPHLLSICPPPPIINNIIELNVVIILSECCNGCIRGGRRVSGNGGDGWGGRSSSGSRDGLYLCGSGMQWMRRAHNNAAKTEVPIVGGLPHLIFLACCTFTAGGNWRGITALVATTTAMLAATPAMTTTATGPIASRKNNWHGGEVTAEVAVQYYCVRSGMILLCVILW
jgi:hypothetical protein